MTPKRLGLFIGLSIVFHIFLIFIFQFLLPLLPKPEHQEQSKSVKVTLLPKTKPVPPPLQPSQPLPKEQMFVDTSNRPKSKETDPNTPLESDNTTKASSVEPQGQGPSFVPNQKGIDAPGLDLENSKASVANNNQPQPPAPKPDEKIEKAEPKSDPPKDKPDPKDPVDPKEQKQAPQVKPVDPIPLRPEGAIEVSKVQPEESPKPSPEAQPKAQQTTQNANPRSPPPAPMTFEKQRNTISGSAPMGAGSSVASKETELGRYKAKLFRGIGSRWYLYVQQDNGQLGVGKVKIKFYVRSDGVITNLEILEGKENASKLAAISRRSIMEISGQLEPFSESLKVQLGEGYFEEVTFSIY